MRNKSILERNNAKSILIICFVLVVVSCKVSVKDKSIPNLETYRKLRQEKLNESRPVIHNNDGCDTYLFPLKVSSDFSNQPRPGGTSGPQIDSEFSISNFLKLRSEGLKGSDVSTISYCTIASSFGQFTHNTRVGEFLTLTHNRPGRKNVVPEFVKLGTDPLEVTSKFAHENGFEFFWSNRINDTHDSGHRPEKPYERWSKLKQAHPEYLFGSVGEKLPHGRWSAIDFSHKEIRDLCIKYYTEVCENYDVDGIELDFFRHLFLFGNVARGETASAAELEMITDMLTQIRKMTERVGMKKGKPILLLVRIPDSIEYCRGVGIDIKTWMEKGLVDIVVGSGYFRLNFWKNLVDWRHANNIKIYAGLSEPRIKDEHALLKRLQNPVYRARSAAAWQAGVDGLYIFNEYNTRSLYLREIGKPEKIKEKNNLYFVTYRDGNPNSYLVNGKSYSSLPVLTPEFPVSLNNNPLKLSIELGDESLPAKIALVLYSKNGNSELIKGRLNGKELKFLKKTKDGLSVYEIPAGCPKPGINILVLNYEKKSDLITLLDIAIFFYRNENDADTKDLATLCFNN